MPCSTTAEIQLRPLPAAEYAAYRRRVIGACHKWDPQVGDVNTIADHVIVLSKAAANQLNRWAEALADELVSMEQKLLRRPELHRTLALPWAIRRALRHPDLQSPDHHLRVMRFDFHPTPDGWAISEVNSDVPGGFSEASALPKLAAQLLPDVHPEGNVAAAIGDALLLRIGDNSRVALVHATAYADDRQVMQFLCDQLQARGLSCSLVAPDHIRWRADGADCIAQQQEGPIHAVVRFFPVEWLCLLPRSARWAGYFAGRVPACNHVTAILSQSKRLPLLWDRLDVRMPTWRALLPETADPRRVSWNRNAEWILKPALGRVGEDIAIREVITPREWKAIARSARLRPGQWVAQRRFESRALCATDGNRHVCIGVFTVDGRAAGFYGRISARPRIDQQAQDSPVLVTNDG